MQYFEKVLVLGFRARLPSKSAGQGFRATKQKLDPRCMNVQTRVKRLNSHLKAKRKVSRYGTVRLRSKKNQYILAFLKKICRIS
jgi:hypothetical protein